MDQSEPQAEEPKKKTVAPLALTEKRALSPRNSKELSQMIEIVAAGKGFPARFDTPAKRIAAYNLANALMGEKWQLALNNIAEIKGSLTIYGELPGALAEQTKEVAEKWVYCIDSSYNEICVKNKNLSAAPWAGVCVIQRKGRAKKEFFYTMDEAKAAGQYPAKKHDGSINNDSPWMKHTKIMLMRKALAPGIKFEFADCMAGVPIAEHEFDMAPDISPSRDVSNTIAEQVEMQYGDGKEEAAVST